MHAAALARELEVERILCPRASGVLSALGLIASDGAATRLAPSCFGGEDPTAERIAREVRALRESLGAGLEGAEPETTYGMRYRGQAFELDVAGSVEPDPAELVERFADAHERRNGYRDPEADGQHPARDGRSGRRPRAGGGAPGRLDEGSRRARFDGEWVEARVLRGEPEAGRRATGPCIFELPEATLVPPPGWQAEVDDRAPSKKARNEQAHCAVEGG